MKLPNSQNELSIETLHNLVNAYENPPDKEESFMAWADRILEIQKNPHHCVKNRSRSTINTLVALYSPTTGRTDYLKSDEPGTVIQPLP